MEFERVYSGKVIGLERLNVSAFGIATWKIVFAGNKSITYQRSTKQQLQFKVGDRIRFHGKFHGNRNQYFHAVEIVDVNDAALWNKEYEKMMSEYILNES